MAGIFFMLPAVVIMLGSRCVAHLCTNELLICGFVNGIATD
jgi:hypothetical protein